MKARFALRPWLTNAALLVLGFGLLLLTRQLISEFSHYTIGSSGVSSWSLVLYAAAVLVVLTQPVNRWTFGIILGVAIACRLVTLLPAPHLSTDIYRYAWDGVVQHAHISPYRYVPGDPALSFLRAPNQELFDHMNRRDYAHTIYPPGAQVLFYLITFINPTMTFMKLVMVLFEGLTVYGLVKLLGEMGIRREQVLLYAWCPMLIWEFGSSGHVDSAAIAFIVLALLFRYRQKPVATGVFLALAVLIKLYPIVLLPALFRRREYKMPVVAGGLIALAYACYAGVGLRVFGFLGDYTREEGMQSGERYFLLEQAQRLPGLHHIPTLAYLVFCAAVFCALTWWCWKTCCQQSGTEEDHTLMKRFQLPDGADFLPPALALSLALMLLFSPHYPWYVAWLVPFFTLMPGLTVFVYLGSFFYLCTTAIAVGYGPKQFLLNQILYGTTLSALGVEVCLLRWPIHRGLFSGRSLSNSADLPSDSGSVK